MTYSSHITRNFQVTIPKEIRTRMPFLHEGDQVAFQVEGNRLILIPQKMIPADQFYYWSPEWQKDIQEAQEDIRSGRVLGPFEDVEVGLSALKKASE